MKTEKQYLTSSFIDELESEATRLMKKGWRIEKPLQLDWNWMRWSYVYRILMVKDGEQVHFQEMQHTLQKHLHKFKYL